MKTLPQRAAEWRLPVDGLRKTARRDPQLRALGTTIGTARAYPAVEAQAIRAAYEAWQAGARKAVPRG